MRHLLVESKICNNEFAIVHHLVEKTVITPCACNLAIHMTACCKCQLVPYWHNSHKYFFPAIFEKRYKEIFNYSPSIVNHINNC